jgi:hypothetical protein
VRKVKNPKRVAAGKKLAEYRKKARVAERVEEPSNASGKEPESWIPEVSLTTVLSIVGISLTVMDLYMRWKSQTKNGKPITKNSEPVPVPVPASIRKTGME